MGSDRCFQMFMILSVMMVLQIYILWHEAMFKLLWFIPVFENRSKIGPKDKSKFSIYALRQEVWLNIYTEVSLIFSSLLVCSLGHRENIMFF